MRPSSGDVASVLTANRPERDPAVTVIVSTRNHARYLLDTATAVAAQDARDVELILVDNASTDGTEALATGFAAITSLPFTYVRLESDQGPAAGRNHGIGLSRGRFLAFTDSDCVPSPRWISEALAAFDEPSVGVVQGRTECRQRDARLLSHFIETRRLDGSFSTSNVVYRRSAIARHRFDRSCAYWEDTDLGFRVRADGWQVAFCWNALVYHQAVPQSLGAWLLWPRHYANWPAKAARYPEFRRALFLRVWVRPLHACFDLAVGGLVALLFGRRRLAAVLAVPYAVAFVNARGLQGRAPVVKAALHAARDAVAFGTLVLGSIRHRRVVL